MLKPCRTCKQEFVGRPNKIYCSIACRRLMEFKRERWEARSKAIECYTHNANRVCLTDIQRRHWLDKAEKTRKELGKRP